MTAESPSRLPLSRLRDWLTSLVATPITAGIIACLLLGAGAAFAFQIDRISRDEKLQQTTVQAQVLASGIAAPLAFDDSATLQEYLGALHADPQILAVAAYDAQGGFVGGYAVAPAKLPRNGQIGEPVISARELTVTVPVVQGDTQLGSVYLRVGLDSWSRRATRYVGIAAIVMMAALLIVVLGASYASLHEAHNQLQQETASRMQAEDALRQSQKMEALGQLTGGVAHDFNNLLMVASGALDLMDRTDDPTKLERLKAGIRHAVDRGAKLTQQLLTFSRRSPLKPEVVDLGHRIRGMDALLDRLQTDGIQIELDLPAGLWPVEVDPSELEVAILNIAINARDAMPGGGMIVISAVNQSGNEGADDMVRVAISDSGTGIAPEILNRIFEPFYTTKGVGHGTGLGLSQVYGFARASGGDVEVRSEVGKGTLISLLLPRSHGEPERAAVMPAVVQASARRRILLVEDDNTVAGMVGDMLSAIGYDHERAVSGDAAMRRLERNPDFSMVLSDMIMPGQLSGIDLVRQISQRWPTMPAILMTGYSEAASTARNEGIRLVTKPFTIQTLSAQIDSILVH
jgi:signal transduction histidine kinase/CheY-like chemotaxis protein